MALTKRLQSDDGIAIDGFSLDDERDCAHRAPVNEFAKWVNFHNVFARGLERHGLSLTPAVQAIFGIQNVAGDKACDRSQSEYP